MLFGEQFALDAPQAGGGGADRAATTTLVPIAVADAASLKRHRLLLMAHPRAQPAEVLVELDAWVRGGGQVVLLADPCSSGKAAACSATGCARRPTSPTPGCSAHWGLRLGGRRGGRGRACARRTRRLRGRRTTALVARCRIGQGPRDVIADADFLMGEGDDAARRLDLLMAELSALESR